MLSLAPNSPQMTAVEPRCLAGEAMGADGAGPAAHGQLWAAGFPKSKNSIYPYSSDISILLLILGWTTALVGAGNYSEWKHSEGRINYLQPHGADQARGI